jgi:microcystin-dependent protein
MAEPFLSEIRIMSFNYAPQGWAMCNGQLLLINQNQALFSLLGTTFGGDGRLNFALPDMRGQTPVHVGDGWTLGQKMGEQAHTLNQSEMPAHNHVINGTSAQASSLSPVNNLWATTNANTFGTAPDTPLNPASMTSIGGSQAHLNMQPYLALTFCIALQGIFPSQN